MTDAGGLQLLPSHKKNFRIKSFFGGSLLLACSVIALIIFLAFFLFVKIQYADVVSDISKIDKELKSVHESRDKTEEEKLLNFTKQGSVIQTILKNHTYWTYGLSSLQSMIQPKVRFTTLSADSAKRTYLFHAVADNFATVARQVASFYANENVESLKLTKVNANNAGFVEFDMTVTLKQKVFSQQK